MRSYSLTISDGAAKIFEAFKEKLSPPEGKKTVNNNDAMEALIRTLEE